MAEIEGSLRTRESVRTYARNALKTKRERSRAKREGEAAVSARSTNGLNGIALISVLWEV